MSAIACAVNAGDADLIKKMLSAMSEGREVSEAIHSKNGAVFGAAAPDGKHEFAQTNSELLVFNGRLYNADNLRPLISPKPKGSGDADVILALHKMKGTKCVHYLDGPFAFVLVHNKGFYAARDPLGLKPLYFAKLNGGWVFATELKAFPEEVKRVTEFPQGGYLDSEMGMRRYFKLIENPPKQVNVADAVELIRVLVTEAVEKRLGEVEEVGLYLTGSLESCIIAALAAEKVKKLRTFSVGLEGTVDGQTAKRVASWLSTDHTHYEVTEQDALDSLQTVVHALESFDAGVVRQAVADHFAVGQAAGKVNALLSGDAANELFGGYAYLRPMFSEKLTQEIRTITEDLHRTSLLRWDRITSFHGIEARAPFTDRKLVHAAFHLPANLKINEEGRSKWILRRAFSTLLPAWVVDRPDSDDTLNQGIQNSLQEYAATVFTDEDLSAAQHDAAKPNLRTKDELLYYQIWSAKFSPDYVPLVGRTHL